MTQQPALDLFLAHCRRRRLAEATTAKYDYLYRHFTTITGADLDPTPEQVDAYCDHQAYLAGATMYKELSFLRTMWNWFEDRHLCHSNPFRTYELPQFTPHLRESIPLDDLERILAYIPGDILRRQCYQYSGYRDNLIWHFCALAGMRISEVLALKLSDLRSGGIYIRNAKAHRSRVVPSSRAWLPP